MLKIRLARGGAKKRPYYSIVVADSHSPRDGRFIEKVGAYNPLLKKDDPNRITLKNERISEWLSKGAQPTDRVARFLSTQGLAKWTPGNNPKKGEPHAKAKERVTEREERAAARAAQPEPEVVEEVAAPAEEAPAEAAAEAAPAEEAAVEAAADAGDDAVAAEETAAPEGVEAVTAESGETPAETGAEGAQEGAGEAAPEEDKG